MKPKQKKDFDSVAMVREIRDAQYRRATDPNFNPKEFDRIKDKWTNILEKRMASKIPDRVQQ